jgi:soluble lytic murein transglycosylase-like protein
MSVASRASLTATAVALTFGIVTQSSGSAAQTSGHERADEARVHGHVAVLDKPTDHFEKSLQLARRKAERIEAAREARANKQDSGDAATSGGFPAPESVGVSSSTLETIAACESGGDPTAVSADGAYHGLYQFDYGTWASVGGSGDPAAASPEEQTYRAALLYSQSGSSPWPICGA